MMVDDLAVRPDGDAASWPVMGDDVVYTTRAGQSLKGQAALGGAVEDARSAALRVLLPAGYAGDLRTVLNRALAKVWWSLDRWRDHRDKGNEIELGPWAARIVHDEAVDWLRAEAPKRLGSVGARPVQVAGEDIADLPDAALMAVTVDGMRAAIVDPPEGFSPRRAALDQVRALLMSRPGGPTLWRQVVREVATVKRGTQVRQELAAFIQACIDGEGDPVLGPRLLTLAARAAKDAQ